jgi:hypothetical protein
VRFGQNPVPHGRLPFGASLPVKSPSKKAPEARLGEDDVATLLTLDLPAKTFECTNNIARA